MSEQRWWIVPVYGYAPGLIQAPSKGRARYLAWLQFSDAGLFCGRDGFWRFLIECGWVREANAYEVAAGA